MHASSIFLWSDYILLANRKFTTKVRLNTSEVLMVEDEVDQQTSFVQKINCTIRCLKSKVKGINYANMKVVI